jgi:O-antigen/teichoic acid export membrane protein
MVSSVPVRSDGRERDMVSSAPAYSMSRVATLVSLTTVGISLVNYAFSLLAVRILAPLEYARFASAQGLLLVLGSGCMAAVPWALARHVAIDRSDEAARTALHFGLWACAIQGLLFAVVGGVVIGEIAGASAGLATAVAAFLLSLVAAPLGILQGEQRLRRIAALRAAETVVRVAGGTALLMLVGKDPQNAIWGFALGSGVLMVASLLSNRRAIPPRRGDPAVLRALFQQSLNMGAIQVLVSMLGSLDTVAIQFAAVSREALPAYQVAALLGRVPLFMSSAISLAYYPAMARSESEAACADQLRKALRLYFLITLPGIALGWYLPHQLLHAISPSNATEVGRLLRWTLLSSAMLGLANVITTAHQARGRFLAAIRLLVVPALLQFPLLVLGGRLFGLTGFTLMLVAVSAVAAILVVLDARHWSPWARSRKGVVASIVGVAALGGLSSFSVYSWCVAACVTVLLLALDLGYMSGTVKRIRVSLQGGYTS